MQDPAGTCPENVWFADGNLTWNGFVLVLSSFLAQYLGEETGNKLHLDH